MIEDLLKEHLGRVAAPAELWTRMERRRSPGVWPIAAALIAMGAVWSLPAGPGVLGSNEAIAMQALTRPGPYEVQGGATREWVKQRTGIELRPTVELLGARAAGSAVEVAHR